MSRKASWRRQHLSQALKGEWERKMGQQGSQAGRSEGRVGPRSKGHGRGEGRLSGKAGGIWTRIHVTDSPPPASR